jgi:peptide/nickel transport system substrate-binding protein
VKKLSVVFVAMLVAVGAGCGGNDKNSSKSSSKSATDTGGVKALDINATPRDQLKDGGNITWAVDQYSSQYNYNHLDGTSVATATILYGTMPEMFVADEKTNLKPDPNYLTSAQITSKSPQVVTYKINPKAHWSDGKPIDWKDFEAQWKALNGSNSKYLISSSTGYERVASVKRGADDREVVVTFSKPFADWQSMYSFLYPASTNSDPDSFNKGWLKKFPVSAGPFKFGKFDDTAKTVTIVRDPDWWGDPAKLDKVITRTLDPDATVGAFVNGEIDVADIGIDPAAYKRAKSAKNGKIFTAAGPDFRHFTINGTAEVFKDLNVRKAFAMAINRAAVGKADLSGLDWPVRTLDNHFFVNTQAGYKDNSGDVGTYDPAAAKALLEKSGWKPGGGFRQKGGKTLTVRFVIPSGVPVSKQEAELTQAMVKDVGIKLDIRTVPSDPFFDKYIVPGNFDVTAFSWVGTPFPISSGKSIYVNPKKDKKGELQIQQNYGRSGSPEIDQLMTQAEEELDVAKARDLANQADVKIWDIVHSLTLYQRPQNWGVTNGLANVGAYGFKTPVYADIGYKK